MKKFRLHALLEVNRVAVGTVLSMASTDIMELVSHMGVDFVMIDCEHGPMQPETVLDLIRVAEAADVAPLVRVSSLRADEILKYLDIGAAGIVIPSIQSRDDAEAAVAACRYPPQGRRGFAPSVRSAGFGLGLDLESHIAASNNNILVIPIIESVAALGELENILSVSGLSAVAFGGIDLSLDMGLLGAKNARELDEAKREILSRCLKRGLPVLTASDNREGLRAEIDQGASMIMFPFATWLVRSGREILSAVRDGES